MHAPALRENKTSMSRVDPLRVGARSAARNPPGQPIAPIATPANLLALQFKMQNRPAPSVPQAAPRTGSLPSGLRAGIEGLSGLPMDDVRVHYNSDKPLQLQAFAFTQGNEIHVAPGQEEHLPHEAWHAVQQKQKRVPTTAQMKGVGLNDSEALEQEATDMGNKAARGRPSTGGTSTLVHHDERSTKSAVGTSPVVQRAGFWRRAGSAVGSVIFGPLWDAGKALRRGYQGGNIIGGSEQYRRYNRQYPGGDKANEYQTDNQLRAAYGWNPTVVRTINLLSNIAADTARYAGWITGISGLIMLATSGAAVPALAPIATVTAKITAIALLAQTSLAAFKQSRLAHRIDNSSAITADLRNEERYVRSEYGQAMVASAAFTTMGLSAKLASGASIPEGWRDMTGQTEASSSLPEVAAGLSGDTTQGILNAGAETYHTNQRTRGNEHYYIKPYDVGEKPKHSYWGLHRLNPVYFLVRLYRFAANALTAMANSFRGEGSHLQTKAGAKFKVGERLGGEGSAHRKLRGMRNFTRGAADQLNARDEEVDGTEGKGHAAARWLKNAFRGADEQRDARGAKIANSPEGKGRTGAKHFLGGLLGIVGGGVGAVVGALGGMISGAMAGARHGYNNGSIGGTILGFLGGGIGGLGVGLVGGAGIGAAAGWDMGHMRSPAVMAKINALLDNINGVAQKASDCWDELVAALTPEPAPAPPVVNAPPSNP